MNKIKKAYRLGWRPLSYCIILAILIGLAGGIINLITVTCIELSTGINPIEQENGIESFLHAFINLAAFFIYAPLIAYVHYKWDGGGKFKVEPKNHTQSKVEPVGTGQPMEPSRKSENHINH